MFVFCAHLGKVNFLLLFEFIIRSLLCGNQHSFIDLLISNIFYISHKSIFLKKNLNHRNYHILTGNKKNKERFEFI